ncbi:MAG: hypothetical protein AAFO02_00550 [Bacteroidota bacterium]
MAITIDDAGNLLNQFTVDKAQGIHQKLRQGLEFENILSPRAATNTWSAPNATPTELLQAYQWQFTPKGNTTLSAVDNQLQPIKVDITLTAEDIEKYFDTYMIEWYEIGKDATEWSFPRYLMDQVYMPKIIEEMNTNSWVGERTTPTAGMAGASVNSVDGYRKKITDAITAGDLTEYATGAFVGNTMVNQVESWCDSLPIPYRDQPGMIFMSNSNAKLYYRDHRDKFGTGNGVAGNQNTELRVEMTKKQIMPINAMEGSNRIIFYPTTTRNMIWGSKRGFDTYFTIRWMKPEVRVLHGTAEIHRFYGFEFWDHLFVNDQA